MNSALIPRALRAATAHGSAVQDHVRRALRQAEVSPHNALVYLNGGTCLDMASKADEALGNIDGKSVSLFCGATVSVKDNFSVADEPVRSCSKILGGYIAPYDSTVVERIRSAGAVLFGRTNMDEHGMGSSSTNSAFGPVLNPWTQPGGEGICAGGSSGGGAAAVAAGLVDVSIGSDTGGSVRHPASFCGLVGLKPTYGLVPRHGLLSYASSLDCPGVITRTTLDAAIAMDALAGSDPRDPTAIRGLSPFVDIMASKSDVFRGGIAIGSLCGALLNVPGSIEEGPVAGSFHASEVSALYEAYCRSSTSLMGINIGIPDEYSIQELDGDVSVMWQESIRMLEDAGATITRVSLPCIKLALPSYYVLACAEAASNLSRYDGMRYGYRLPNSLRQADSERVANTFNDQSADIFFSDLSKTRGSGFGPEVIRRILTGTFVLSQSAYHDYYETAALCRQLIKTSMASCLSGTNFGAIHALFGPTTPGLPFFLAEPPDASGMLLNDIYTIPANLSGLPSVTIPVGISLIGSGRQKVPIGMQLIGRPNDEGRMLKIARAIECRANFASKVPSWLENAYSSD